MTRLKYALAILLFIALVLSMADMIAEHNDSVQYREAVQRALQPR